MATVAVNAEYASKKCKERMDEIERQYESDKSDWFKEQAGRKRTGGRWPFRFKYYPTQAELEDIYYGRSERDPWSWYYPEMRIRERSSYGSEVLLNILRACAVAMTDKMECRDHELQGCVMLSDKDILYFNSIVNKDGS